MRPLLLLLASTILVAAPAVAAEVDASGCTDVAHVHWETSWGEGTVTGAVVEVRGCEDGTPVGLQLLTDDGDVPDEPLVSEVENEHARFDLEPLGLRIEPVTGVRILIQGEPVSEFVAVVVEQRLFAGSGNEQRGLRQTTPREVPFAGQYLVPGAPTRYAVVVCAAMNTTLPNDLVDQGVGTFSATQSGTHVVCYQQQPGTPGGPPNLETPQVREGTEVPDESFTDDSPASPGDSLATTGLNVLGAGLTALLLVFLGRRLLRLGGD